jgi:uncharacterized protein (UPF0335 family)
VTAAANPVEMNMPKQEAGIGHNSEVVVAAQLRSFVERIEHLVEERQTIVDDIKEVRAEAKSSGFDPRTLNEMIKLRKLDKAEREMRESMRDLYAAALGVFG